MIKQLSPLYNYIEMFFVCHYDFKIILTTYRILLYRKFFILLGWIIIEILKILLNVVIFILKCQCFFVVAAACLYYLIQNFIKYNYLPMEHSLQYRVLFFCLLLLKNFRGQEFWGLEGGGCYTKTILLLEYVFFLLLVTSNDYT